MLLKTLAVLFGILFLLIGVLGFIPDMTPEGMLFGYFLVNSAHNIVHLITGAIFIWAGMISPFTAKLFFQIFGIVYGAVAVLGFMHPNEHLFGIIANSYANSWLHLFIALISLVIGFGMKVRKKSSHQ